MLTLFVNVIIRKLRVTETTQKASSPFYIFTMEKELNVVPKHPHPWERFSSNCMEIV